jgi:hypothetical protein
MLELGYQEEGEKEVVEVGYRIYISGDTLMGQYYGHSRDSLRVRADCPTCFCLNLAPAAQWTT